MPTVRIKSLPLITALTLSCLAPAIVSAAWPSDPTVNVPLCTAAGDQLLCTGIGSQYTGIVSDGAGGAIVTWEDYRSTTTGPKIYAQRVSAAGVPLWTADGVALCAAAGEHK